MIQFYYVQNLFEQKYILYTLNYKQLNCENNISIYKIYKLDGVWVKDSAILVDTGNWMDVLFSLRKTGKLTNFRLKNHSMANLYLWV